MKVVHFRIEHVIKEVDYICFNISYYLIEGV